MLFSVGHQAQLSGLLVCSDCRPVDKQQAAKHRIHSNVGIWPQLHPTPQDTYSAPERSAFIPTNTNHAQHYQLFSFKEIHTSVLAYTCIAIASEIHTLITHLHHLHLQGDPFRSVRISDQEAVPTFHLLRLLALSPSIDKSWHKVESYSSGITDCFKFVWMMINKL